MYKMYKKDRGQWVEAASFNSSSKARYYAKRMGFTLVDNADEEAHWFYSKDCWTQDRCILKEALTDDQIEELRSGETYNDLDVRVCRYCGELIGLNTHDEYIEIDGNYWCDSDCADSDGCFYCEDCERWYDSGTEHYSTNGGSTVCEYCYENNYGCCSDCGAIYPIDEMYSNDYGYYCPDCWHDEEDEIIKSYHSDYRPDIEIQRTVDDKPEDATIGTEVEAECRGSHSRNEVASAVNDIVNRNEDLFMFEEDGSLSDEGYETISQPFTMRWFEKNQDLFKKMFNTMVDMGARSHDTTTCGFHVHVGRHFFGNQEKECIDRLIYVFEKYRQQLEVFSRRKNFNWCEFPSVRVGHPVEWSKLDEVKKLDKYNFEGHHSAINVENWNTIEFRIFKGTLNFTTYYATLEFVNNLIHYVKDKTDEEVEQGNFRDILDYLPTIHLKQYCLDRNII